MNPIPALFAAGEQGGYYDPADFASLFQDSAGTTPVTAVGQPVGKINDKSGRGNHLIQATAASRPVLRQDGSGYYYLEFDGVDDRLATAATVDFTGTSKVSTFLGVTNTNSTTTGVVVELSAVYNSSAGSFCHFASTVNSGDWGFGLNGSAVAFRHTAVQAVPHSEVVSCVFDTTQATAATEIAPRVNGVTPSLTNGGAADAGSGAFGNYTIYVGRRGDNTLPFNGRMYQIVIRGATTSAADITNAERYVGGKMGIAL